MINTSNDSTPLPLRVCGAGAGIASSDLLALRERLWARAENAYCDMIEVARKDESLGWEIKVERGQFGRKELDAHCAMSEKSGRHHALAEACREIDNLLKTLPPK